MDTPIKNILKNINNIKVNGSLWLESGEGHFFGPGPVELLERIADTGSISEAAKQMNMSYKKAWELVSRLNAQCTDPVVIPKAGGEKGGGSTITKAAMELIHYHHRLRERFAAFLEQETEMLKT